MSWLSIICVILAILFVVLTLRGWSRIKAHKWMRASLYAVPILFAFAGLFFLLLILSNLTTYQRLTYERDIVRLSMVQIADQRFEIKLDYLDPGLDRISQVSLIKGDEWRLEARILKWQGWANIMGLDSYYKLDRLSGRYRSIEQAGSELPSVLDLSTKERGLNLWELKRLMKSNLPFIDAYYGQAVFLPLQHAAAFNISINQAGLIARPANEIAKRALEDW